MKKWMEHANVGLPSGVNVSARRSGGFPLPASALVDCNQPGSGVSAKSEEPPEPRLVGYGD